MSTSISGQHRLESEIIAHGELPRHVAVIMDGNGRWAQRRGMPRIAGHRAGRHAVRETVRTCAQLGIEALTLYTFSRENWKRPSYEVKALWRFLEEVLRTEFLELSENNVRLIASGDLPRIPDSTRRALEKAQEDLSSNSGMILNLALSYGGRDEIVRAARRFAEDVREGRMSPEEMTESLFQTYLFAPELPDPDLLIRTSGEMRLSNFLLWQAAYSEIVVTDVLWPDFRKDELYAAIAEYQKRSRRFGGV
ncbi:MAG TPA: isoprenyl transferase [Candidatus Krumholzibacteria bacterium]|nr:isoprenyl transferase [Candidatus Krumholzibacteria bacterium]